MTPTETSDTSVPPDSAVQLRSSLAAHLAQLFRDVIFTLWWGGLTFYSTVVIHVGTHVLGTERQGFITQRVTYFLNALGAAVVVLLWFQVRRSRQMLPWVLWTLLGLSQLALFVDHYRLTGLLDFETETVSSSQDFYREHAIYLWLTAVQWCAGLGWMARESARRATME